MKDQVWDTEKVPMDRRQQNLMNGFHTVWDAEFKEDEYIGRVALNKNVAFLKFTLSEVMMSLNFTSLRWMHKT